jgi:hypothetical protein
MDLPVSGGEDYQVALLGAEPAMTTGGPRISGCDIYGPDIDLPGIELADTDLLWVEVAGDPSGGIEGVAISAPWNITPRSVSEGDTSLDIEAAAIALLASRGFDAETVSIQQVVEADLDGDGSIETFVVAEDTELANDGSGTYSILFVSSPSWSDPVVVAESVIPADESGYPARFRVGAVADLSGDGIMELVLHGAAWEASWVAVYEMEDSGLVERLIAGCGV